VKRVGEYVSKEISKQTYLHTKETNEQTDETSQENMSQKRTSLRRENVWKENMIRKRSQNRPTYTQRENPYKENHTWSVKLADNYEDPRIFALLVGENAYFK